MNRAVLKFGVSGALIATLFVVGCAPRSLEDKKERESNEQAYMDAKATLAEDGCIVTPSLDAPISDEEVNITCSDISTKGFQKAQQLESNLDKFIKSARSLAEVKDLPLVYKQRMRMVADKAELELDRATMQKTAMQQAGSGNIDTSLLEAPSIATVPAAASTDATPVSVQTSIVASEFIKSEFNAAKKNGTKLTREFALLFTAESEINVRAVKVVNKNAAASVDAYFKSYVTSLLSDGKALEILDKDEEMVKENKAELQAITAELTKDIKLFYNNNEIKDAPYTLKYADITGSPTGLKVLDSWASKLVDYEITLARETNNSDRIDQLKLALKASISQFNDLDKLYDEVLTLVLNVDVIAGLAAVDSTNEFNLLLLKQLESFKIQDSVSLEEVTVNAVKKEIPLNEVEVKAEKRQGSVTGESVINNGSVTIQTVKDQASISSESVGNKTNLPPTSTLSKFPKAGSREGELEEVVVTAKRLSKTEVAQRLAEEAAAEALAFSK